MRVLREGRKQKGWSRRFTCTGNGNGAGGSFVLDDPAWNDAKELIKLKVRESLEIFIQKGLSEEVENYFKNHPTLDALAEASIGRMAKEVMREKLREGLKAEEAAVFSEFQKHIKERVKQTMQEAIDEEVKKRISSLLSK